jgi:hypothetical protein
MFLLIFVVFLKIHQGKMKNLYDKALKKHIETKSRFIGIYENFITNLSGEDIISAIKWFDNHYNSLLRMIIEFDPLTKEAITYYKSKENNHPDIRGIYNYSYFNQTGEFIYNQDEATHPIVKIKPTKLTTKCWDGFIDVYGNFYQCGYQCHISLADELFLSKTVVEATPIELIGSYHNDTILERRGWVKVSSKQILFHKRLTDDQKSTIIKLVEILGFENYRINMMIYSKNNINDAF